MPSWNNWSGRLEHHPQAIRFVRTEEDASARVLSAKTRGATLRVVGAGHSHAPLVIGAEEIIDVGAMAGLIEVDQEEKRAWIAAGTPIYMLGPLLHQHGLALHNQGDIDRQTLAGATATGTHGTGRLVPNLSSAVIGLRLIDGAGGVRALRRADDDEHFNAFGVHLGAMGLVTAIELQLRESFVLEEAGRTLPGDALLELIPELTVSHDRFEFFWYPQADQAQIKTMHESTDPPVYPVADEGGRRAYSFEVLPNHRPHKHTEMEYSVPASEGPACFEAIRTLLLTEFQDVAWPVEYRLLARDGGWLSNAYERDTVTISVHQDVRIDERAYYEACEAIFRSFDGRPHWGKVNSLSARDLELAYPRWRDWWAVRDQLDPDGVFLNDYLRLIRAQI